MSETWVYIRSEPGLYTVGFYDPDGQWHPDSDWAELRDARNQVHFLNGGTLPDTKRQPLRWHD